MNRGLDELSSNESKSYRHFVSHFPTGVTVVAGSYKNSNYGFTCQSFVSVSLSPPTFAIFPSRSSKSWPMISPTGRFCVNFLRHDQQELAKHFANSIPDKFKGVEYELSRNGLPILKNVVAYCEALIINQSEVADHLLVLGKITESIIFGGEPLIYFRSGYFHGLKDAN